MDERLRRSAAHLLVDDVAAPSLDDEAHHHLRRVLRLRAGSLVTVTDGAGRWRECEWAGDRLDVVGEIAEVTKSRSVTIAAAIPKQDRPEWMVSKLVECGVDRIVLLHSERSVVRWDAARAEKNVARLGRVARSALEQSRRVFGCVIDGPVDARDVLPAALVAEPGGRRLEAGDSMVAIGPEGGWSPDEVAVAAGTIGLGPTVLRVETAALVAAVTMLGSAG